MPPETDDDVIITIPDDTVAIDGVKPDATVDKKDDPPKRERGAGGQFVGKAKVEPDRIAALERDVAEKQRLADEAQARAERFAEQARLAHEARAKSDETALVRERQAMGAHWEKLHSDKSQIETGIAAAQERERSAVDRYTAAREAGDVRAEAEALKMLSESQSTIAQLEQGKIAIDGRISDTQRLFEEHTRARQKADEDAQRERQERERQPPKQETPPSPDEWIDKQAKAVLGTAGADWLKGHKEFVTDPKMNRKFLRFADDYADDHGKDALKSREFLEALNGKFFPDNDDGEAEQEEREPEPVREERPKAKAAAPVQRRDQFFSSRNMNASQVKLPPKLAAFVKNAGLDPTKYALQAVADIKAGNLPKNYLDPDYDHGF